MAATSTPPRLRNNTRRPRASLSKPPLSPMPRPERPITIGHGNINWSPPASPTGRPLALSEDSFWMVDVDECGTLRNSRGSAAPKSSFNHLMMPQDSCQRKLPLPTLRPRTNSDASDTDLFGLAFLDEQEQNCSRQR